MDDAQYPAQSAGRSQLLTTGNFRDWHTVVQQNVAPCPGDNGGPSEQAYTRPAPGRPDEM